MQSAVPDDRQASGVLHLECTNVYGTLGASWAGVRDGGDASVSLCGEPGICDACCAHGFARNQPRPARSAGRRILQVQVAASVEKRWCTAASCAGRFRRGGRAGEPGGGARYAGDGADGWEEVAECEPVLW